jgi:hypothetical protein
MRKVEVTFTGTRTYLVNDLNKAKKFAEEQISMLPSILNFKVKSMGYLEEE